MVFGGCGLNKFVFFFAGGEPHGAPKNLRYHTFASTQDARRFAYSFDCRNEGGYEPARIAEACKMTFKDFVMLGKDERNQDQ